MMNDISSESFPFSILYHQRFIFIISTNTNMNSHHLLSFLLNPTTIPPWTLHSSKNETKIDRSDEVIRLTNWVVSSQLGLENGFRLNQAYPLPNIWIAEFVHDHLLYCRFVACMILRSNEELQSIWVVVFCNGYVSFSVKYGRVQVVNNWSFAVIQRQFPYRKSICVLIVIIPIFSPIYEKNTVNL